MKYLIYASRYMAIRKCPECKTTRHLRLVTEPFEGGGTKFYVTCTKCGTCGFSTADAVLRNRIEQEETAVKCWNLRIGALELSPRQRREIGVEDD
jgi:Zn ribbon nucleic-acid-binding protein